MSFTKVINPIKKFKADKPKTIDVLLHILKPKLKNNPYLTNSLLDKLRNNDKYAHECSDYADLNWDPNPDFGTGVAYPRNIINYYVTNGITGHHSKIIDANTIDVDKENHMYDKIHQLYRKPVTKRYLDYYEHDKIKGTENYKVIPHYSTKIIIPNQSKIKVLRHRIENLEANPPKYAQIGIGEGNLVTPTNTKVRIRTVYDYLKGGE